MAERRQSSRPKMAVIRFVRPSEAVFYDAFERLEVRFIYNSQTPFFGTTRKSSSYPIRTKNLELVNLRFKPKYLFDPFSLLNRGIFTNRSWVELEGLEKQLEDVDVVNITDIFYVWSGQTARLARKLGKKLVAIVWETIPHHPATFIPPYSFSVKEGIKSTDLFILRSRAALRFTDSLNIPREKIKVIYKGVDLSMFHPSSSFDKLRTTEGQVPPETLPRIQRSARSGRSQDEPEGVVRGYNLPPEADQPRAEKPKTSIKILYVGQLVKSKGIDDLLKAFVSLSKELSNIELVFAGGGPLEENIHVLAEEYPIRHLGVVNYTDLPNIYRGADIFCSPSKDSKCFGFKIGEEAFSYTLMEAQASGLPIVSTRCGGIPEEVGEDNLLVEQGDVDGLHRALKKLIENRGLREKLGRANRKRAEKLFDLKKQAQKTEKAILSIL